MLDGDDFLFRVPVGDAALRGGKCKEWPVLCNSLIYGLCHTAFPAVMREEGKMVEFCNMVR